MGGMSLIPAPSPACASTQHVFVLASCSDLLAPPSVSFSALRKLAGDLGRSTEPCYRINLMLDDFACPERCSEVLAELSSTSAVQCSSSSVQMTQSEHDAWRAGYWDLDSPEAEMHQKYPSPMLRPDLLSAVDVRQLVSPPRL